MEKLINISSIQKSALNYLKNQPFPHIVVDNFFDESIARKLELDFPDFDADVWHGYNNPIEVKKLCNSWNAFPSQTFKIFSYLVSNKFAEELSKILYKSCILYPDPGLHGGGWHIHKSGGKLNTHLDYSIHPKLRLQRKLNLIVFLNSSWSEEWGGKLGLWSNESPDAPGVLVKEISPKFNRAVIFDTTMNSWHGLPDPIQCPDGQYRKSIAVYYLVEPTQNVSDREKALFAPTDKQRDNKEILELIAKRATSETASQVYEVSDDSK